MKYILLKTNNERTTTVRTKYRNAIFWQEKMQRTTISSNIAQQFSQQTETN